MTLLVARAYGATGVIAVDIQPHRLSTALTLGATTVINAAQENVADRVCEATDSRGVDVVIDASGSAQATAITTQLVRRGGVITLVGWPEMREVTFPIEDVIEKELDVRGVNRYCNTYPQAISLLISGALDSATLLSLVTHRFPLAEVPHAFDYAATNKDRTIKVMVE
jgi:L-iditol 2-dehydrogenase